MPFSMWEQADPVQVGREYELPDNGYLESEMQEQFAPENGFLECGSSGNGSLEYETLGHLLPGNGWLECGFCPEHPYVPFEQMSIPL